MLCLRCLFSLLFAFDAFLCFNVLSLFCCGILVKLLYLFLHCLHIEMLCFCILVCFGDVSFRLNPFWWEPGVSHFASSTAE